MKIVAIEPYVLSDTLDNSFYFSQWHYSSRTICIVKIVSDTGHIGWGEGYGPASIIHAGIQHLSQYVIGQNPLETETIWETLYRRTMDFSRSGVLMSAISAIDVALWDLKGKILDMPVYQLLGGPKREYITPYATGLYFSDDMVDMGRALADEAAMYVDQGYRAIKMKVGIGVKRDIENVKQVRAAIGDDVALMIDANHAYSLREAKQLAREVEQYNISWFEEPISPEYYDQYRELRESTTIPIAGGECEYLRFGFQRLLQAQSIDIAQPDICATGGLTEAKRISTLTSARGVEIVPHTWGTGIAIAAASHFVLNLDPVPGRLVAADHLMEYDRTENKLRDQLTQSDARFEDGRLYITDAPGLGISVDADCVERHRIEVSSATIIS